MNIERSPNQAGGIFSSEAVMKLFGILLAWCALSAVIIYGVMSPEHGLMFKNPLAAMSLGLIGLGLCMESHKQLKARQSH
jgi:hypothetical protein